VSDLDDADVRSRVLADLADLADLVKAHARRR